MQQLISHQLLCGIINFLWSCKIHAKQALLYNILNLIKNWNFLSWGLLLCHFYNNRWYFYINLYSPKNFDCSHSIA